nr:hypothetical protein [Lactobacillus helveticus]
MEFKNLDELKAQISKYRPLDQDQLKALEKEIRVEHVWSSNAIEGSKISKFETEAIIRVPAKLDSQFLVDDPAD